MTTNPHIELGDLVVEYDPIVETASGRVAGAEIVAPFVKIDELPTSAWRLVLLNALVTSVRWNQRGLVKRSFVTALPLGAMQLDDSTINQAIRASLAGSGANPYGLQLILDEDILLHADERRMEQLVELTGLGVRLAVVGLNACTHVARHRDQLRVSLLRVAASEFDQPTLPTMLERAAALELELIATGVDDESAFVEARRYGSTFSSGALHRCADEFSEIYESLGLVN